MFLLGSQKDTIDNLQVYLHGNREQAAHSEKEIEWYQYIKSNLFLP